MRGTTCPRCGQHTSILKSGVMGRHRTANYVMGQKRGGRIRERCAYAGVTPAEAREGITSLRKAIAEYQAAKAAEDDAAEDRP